MHFFEAEDADGAAFLLGPRVVGADADALERVEVTDFIRDCVLGHRREGAEDADGPGGGSTFLGEHVVDKGEGVAPAQLAQWPVAQSDALDLHVGDAAYPMVVGVVGALRPGVPFGPGLEVVAEGVGSIREAVRLVDGALRFGLATKGSLPPVPGRLRNVVLAIATRVPSNPDDRARGVAAFDGRLAPHAASSRCRVRKSSTSAGSIRRAAPSL